MSDISKRPITTTITQTIAMKTWPRVPYVCVIKRQCGKNNVYNKAEEYSGKIQRKGAEGQ